MYTIIGDYVRLGDSVGDPLHSTVVQANDTTVLSINRTGGKLNLHVWRRVQYSHVSEKPDLVEPVLSTNFENLRREFVKDERRKVR